MLICKIQNMNSETREMIMDEEEDDNMSLITNLYNGAECAVLSVECQVDDDPTHNYYNVVFANGSQCTALGGYHLNGIENWK